MPAIELDILLSGSQGKAVFTIEGNCLPLFYPCAMPISSEALKQDLDQLTQDQLQQVADFIAFLKFRDRHRRRLTLNPSQLAAPTLKLDKSGQPSWSCLLPGHNSGFVQGCPDLLRFLVTLATEFAQEDRDLAKEGICDYAVMLAREDRL